MRNFFTAKNLWQQDITFKERTKAGMKTAGMIGITAWLYYRRVWAAIFLILPGIWLYREFLEEESKKKEQEFQKQFREMIQTLSSALNTGYSVENAFYEEANNPDRITPSLWFDDSRHNYYKDIPYATALASDVIAKQIAEEKS